METTINYLVDRAHGMEPLLEWVVKRQLQEIEPQDMHGADAGMHDPVALSRNLWGYLNLAVAGTSAAADFHKVKRLNGLEAWRRIVVPLKPRSEARRNALHTAVHNPPRSRNMTSVINDLDDWEKVVEEFELCGGVISESDRRAVFLKKLPPGVPHSLVSNLRRCGGYREMTVSYTHLRAHET